MAFLYVETSALLSHLLAEGGTVGPLLRDAERLFSSSLTALEADRGLRRAKTAGRITADSFTRHESWLWRFFSSCQLIPADDTIVQITRRDFPVEPIRAMGALHVMSALWCSAAAGPLALLSLDDRVRANGSALGLQVVP